ncbi:hypothetical protein [Allorhodopirellula heiligendammensis]|uniref:hypothetical protein n=1 Tax=Allorhodopirellula heiligendammensis TaxID=2714739 RepID=UPI0011B7F099|nr:hypothetical protein [Allorhodopirellula heiligendammensis]
MTGANRRDASAFAGASAGRLGQAGTSGERRAVIRWGVSPGCHVATLEETAHADRIRRSQAFRFRPARVDRRVRVGVKLLAANG